MQLREIIPTVASAKPEITDLSLLRVHGKNRDNTYMHKK